MTRGVRSLRAAASALAGVVSLVAPAGCEGRPQVASCGAGTVEQAGVCVALPPGEVRCGEGTIQDPATRECVPLVVCGAGTVEDEATGDCVATSECGPGTFFDPNDRVCRPETSCGTGTRFDAASGACVPNVVCGAGTVLDEESGACRPGPPCADGAVLNEATGQCTSDLVCGDGQIVVAGACVEPGTAVALEADVFEAAPDQNDPLLGGAPETLLLEAVGERAVARGVIGRPVDVAGNGTLVQDRDVWTFVGTAGTRLRVEAISIGAPSPSFYVEGPRGYARSAPRVGDAARDMILPYDGAYDIVVVPLAFLTSGLPQGDPDSGYVLVVEELPLPMPRLVDPGANGLSPHTLTGDLFDMDGNGFRVNAASRTPVMVTFRGLSGEVIPALVALHGTDLIADVPHIPEDGVASFFLSVEDGAKFYVDWNDAIGPDDDYTIDVQKVPLVSRGAVPADTVTVTSTRDVAGKEAVAFQFAIDDPQVVLIDLFGTGLSGPDVQVVGPGGTRAKVDDDDELFFFADPGEYIVFSRNDGTSDDTGVGATLTFLSPYDLGSLDETNLEGSFVAGSDLLFGYSGYEEAWTVVRTSIPALLTLNVDVTAGDPELSVYNYDGTLLRALGRPHLDRPLHVVNRDPRPVLLRLSADDRNAVGWSIAARVTTLPTRIDAEPDDTRFQAVDLGTAPLVVRGALLPNDVDVFTFHLDAPVDPGDSIRVLFDNLDSDSTTSSVTDGAFVRVYDAAFAPLASIPSPASSAGTLGANTATHIAGYEGQGPFYVEIDGDFLTAAADYLLSIEVVGAPVEVEPNDALADADPLGPLPASIIGWRSGDDPQDTYLLDLPATLGADASLVLQAKNLENSNALTVALLDPAGAVVAQTSRVLAVLDAASLPAGAYHVVVSGAGGGEPVYSLDASIGGRAEHEPNETAALFDDTGVLGDAPLVMHGRSLALDVDVVGFTVSPPLAGLAGLAVEVVNLDDGTPLSVEVHAGAALDATTLLARDDSVATELVAGRAGAGPFFVRIAGAGTAPDRWRLRVQRADPVEHEPNDATASVVPTLPVDLRGSVGGTDADRFSFQVDGGSVLHVLLENLADQTSLHAALVGPSSAPTTRAQGEGFRVPLSAAALPAGTYTVVVTSTDASTTATDLYRLSVESP